MVFHLVNKLRKAKAHRAEAERRAAAAQAEIERRERTAAFRAAVRRGDTRAQAETYPAAKEATLAALRLEVKR